MIIANENATGDDDAWLLHHTRGTSKLDVHRHGYSIAETLFSMIECADEPPARVGVTQSLAVELGMPEPVADRFFHQSEKACAEGSIWQQTYITNWGEFILYVDNDNGFDTEEKLKEKIKCFYEEGGEMPECFLVTTRLSKDLEEKEGRRVEEEGKGEEFVAGDIVGLKSGGPEMTVEGVWPIEGQVICSWFTDGNVQTRMFPAACLFKVEPSHD